MVIFYLIPYYTHIWIYHQSSYFLLIHTLVIFAGARVSVYGAPSTAGCFLTPVLCWASGSGRSALGSALAVLELAGSPQIPNEPERTEEREEERSEWNMYLQSDYKATTEELSLRHLLYGRNTTSPSSPRSTWGSSGINGKKLLYMGHLVP